MSEKCKNLSKEWNRRRRRRKTLWQEKITKSCTVGLFGKETWRTGTKMGKKESKAHNKRNYATPKKYRWRAKEKKWHRLSTMTVCISAYIQLIRVVFVSCRQLISCFLFLFRRRFVCAVISLINLSLARTIELFSCSCIREFVLRKNMHLGNSPIAIAWTKQSSVPRVYRPVQRTHVFIMRIRKYFMMVLLPLARFYSGIEWCIVCLGIGERIHNFFPVYFY